MTQMRTIPTGLDEIDAPYGGIPIGQVSGIAGRPNSGKYTLGYQLAASVSDLGARVFVLSTGGDKYTQDVRVQHTARSLGLDAEALTASMTTLHDTRATVRSIEASLPDDIEVLFIDCVQLLYGSTDNGFMQQISADLAELATRRDIAVVVCSEISRSAEGIAATPAHLTSCDAIDFVVLLYREGRAESTREDVGGAVQVAMIVDARSEKPRHSVIELCDPSGTYLL